jgi:integrase
VQGYIDKVIEKRKAKLTAGTIRIWENFKNKFQLFEGDYKSSFGEMNRAKVEEFATYLANYTSRRKDGRKLSFGSQIILVRCLQAVLNDAYKDGIITFSPSTTMPEMKGERKQKQFLTLAELQKLQQTECTNDTVKRLLLFSALTGMRHSDCVALRWENITDGENPSIKFTQQKTKGVVYMPISEEALQFCGQRKSPKDKVFEKVHSSSKCNTIIEKWIERAEIDKKITFHCFRHTFATLQLTHGTDIYTVSKMLGHSDVKTTQIYAQIVDEKKQQAANAVKLNVNS